MDSFEIIGYVSLGVLAVLLAVSLVAGLSMSLPGVIVAVLALVGVGALLIKVLKERLSNAEDDHYANSVDQ